MVYIEGEVYEFDPGDLIEPTAEQCYAHERVGSGVATWYPQMGGYSSKAIVVGDDDFDVYIWHDGDFPFGDGRSPICMHHCDGAQFVEFGSLLMDIEERTAEEDTSDIDIVDSVKKFLEEQFSLV